MVGLALLTPVGPPECGPPYGPPGAVTNPGMPDAVKLALLGRTFGVGGSFLLGTISKFLLPVPPTPYAFSRLSRSFKAIANIASCFVFRSTAADILLRPAAPPKVFEKYVLPKTCPAAKWPDAAYAVYALVVIPPPISF